MPDTMIEFYRSNWRCDLDPIKYEEDLELWVEEQMQKGGIEEKIDRAVKVLAVLFAEKIESGQIEVATAADLLDAEGHDFTIRRT